MRRATEVTIEMIDLEHSLFLVSLVHILSLNWAALDLLPSKEVDELASQTDS